MYTFLEEVVFQAVSSGWNQPLAVEINRFWPLFKRLKSTASGWNQPPYQPRLLPHALQEVENNRFKKLFYL